MPKSAQSDPAFHRNRSATSRRALQIASRLSAAIGIQFFCCVAEQLAKALQADCVYLGEFLGGRTERVKTLGACLDRQPGSFEFELAGSASALIALGKPCLCRAHAQERYPDDPVFRNLGAEACAGVPLINPAGHPLGVIMAVYRKPILNTDAPKAMLDIFVPRAAAELERKQQDEQLRQSEQRHRAFIELNKDAMGRIEFEQAISTALPEQEQLERIYQHGYLAECNDALARQLGLQTAEELIGRRVNDLTPLSNPSVRNATLHAIRSGYRFTTVETSPVGPEGISRYLLLSQWGIVDKGVLQRIWGSARDITELKLSEMALDASEQSMSELLENLPLMVVMLHPNGEIAGCNPHLFQFTGWGPSDVAGKDWVDLMLPAEEHGRVRAILETSISDASNIGDAGLPIHFESPLLGPQGDSRWIAWDSTSVRDSDGKSLLTINIGRDITDFKALQAKFYQAQKLESIGRLAGGLAHDFDNLLTVIMGHCGLMLEKRSLADTAHTAMDEIRKAAEKGAGLTQRLFAFSQRRPLRPEILNLNDLIAEDRPMICQLIGKRVQLVTNLESSLGMVHADVGHVHQIIVNLVVNARDAMPDAGILTVSTSNVDVGTSASGVTGVAPGNYVQLTVTDSGTGMTEDVRSHLFEPFYTTKVHGQGTGLGLSTVYGIVCQSGGQIMVETAPGEGTSVRILLPRVQWEPSPVPQPHCGSGLPRGTETILLMEDRADLRNVAASILRDLGYRVLEAVSPAQALEFVAFPGDSDARIHLLLTDVIMSGTSGSELAEAVKASCKEIKVLFMSGSAGPTSSRQNLSEGGFAWLQKPFTQATLARAVRDILDEN
jgi:two-component system cell cycle sensor histidine kinase/response regulator CckA